MRTPRRSWLRCGAPLLLAELICASPVLGATRFAIVAGNNVGDASDGALRWAEHDARRVRDLLVELGSVAAPRTILSLGASADDLRRELIRLRGQVEETRRRGERTEILFFFSGHGDAENLHLGRTRLPIETLRADILEIPADARVVVIDACRGDALKRGRGKGARRAPGFDISLAREAGPHGLVLITSAGSGEIAQESDALKSSFFTHHLVSGLRGAADSDRDQQVTLAELYRYAYHRTLASSHGTVAAVQHPEIELDLAGEGEIVLAHLAQASATLRLAPQLHGDLLIVDDRSGQVVAEVRKREGETVALGLPAGRFRVQLRRGDTIAAGEVALPWGGTRELRPELLTAQPLEAALEKGSALDPEPWSLSVAARGALPAALGAGFAGGLQLTLERELLDWPVFAALDLQLAHVAAENSLWRYHQLEQHLGLGVGYGLSFGPARLAATLLGGLMVVEELALRHDGAHVSAVTGAPSETTGVASGPYAGLELGLRFAVAGPLSVGIGVGGHAGWLPISGAHRIAAELHGNVGWAVQF